MSRVPSVLLQKSESRTEGVLANYFHEASTTVVPFPKHANLQGIDGRSQMGSALPRHVHAGAHDSRQVLTFQGKSCSVFMSFTNYIGQAAGKKRCCK